MPPTSTAIPIRIALALIVILGGPSAPCASAPATPRRVLERVARGEAARRIYGIFEMPFLLRRIDGQWKAEPEPYFMILNR